MFSFLKKLSLIGFTLFSFSLAYADDINPSLLSIKENKIGWFDVTWKVPTKNNKALGINAKLPESMELIGTPLKRVVPGAYLETSRYKTKEGLLAAWGPKALNSFGNEGITGESWQQKTITPAGTLK